MTSKRKIVWLLAGALALAVVEIALGAEIVKHSGSVIAVDRSAGTVTLGELGPWRVVRGETVVTRRVIVVTPETQFARVRRGAEGETEYAGDFVEQTLAAGDVAAGEFVTIDCRREGKRLIALKVTVTSLEE